jgi:SagB-type dehydrogenase family enzyme
MLPLLCVLFVIGNGEKEILLPAPSLALNMSLEAAMHERRSIRSFSDTSLTIEQLSQILWAAQGITGTLHGHTLRTAPSAGALYPLELYVILGQGIYHYFPHPHKLVRIKTGDARKKLSDAALSQSAISDAPCSIVITAIYERTTVKYAERGIRYVHIEVGHAAQNILLETVSLGLGAVPIGAFYDERVKSAIGCSDEEVPLYIIPIGVPSS